LRTEVAGRGYFVKIHRGVGWAEIAKNLLRCACRCSALRMSGGRSSGCANCGVDSMRAAAFGCEATIRRGGVRSS
jgi:heptose I phosphotransferase